MNEQSMYLISDQGLRREDNIAMDITKATGICRIMTHARVVKENWGTLAELTDSIIFDLSSTQILYVNGMEEFIRNNSTKIIFLVTADILSVVQALNSGLIATDKEALIKAIKKILNIA